MAQGNWASSGGSSGSGVDGTLFEVSNGGSAVITTPGLISTTYGEDVAIVRLLGATGSYSQSGHTQLGVLPPITQTAGAEVLLVRQTTDAGASWTIRGVLPGEPIGTYTLANALALNATTYAGCVVAVTAAIADFDGAATAHDAEMIAIDARLKFRKGFEVLRSITAALSGVTSTTITKVGTSVALPFWRSGDWLDCEIAIDKTLDTQTATFTLYMGVNGDTTDFAVATYGLAPSPNTSNSWGGKLTIQAYSDTAVRREGSATVGAPWIGTSAANNALADSQTTGLTSFALGTTKLTLAVKCNTGTGDTINVTSFRVTHRMG